MLEGNRTQLGKPSERDRGFVPFGGVPARKLSIIRPSGEPGREPRNRRTLEGETPHILEGAAEDAMTERHASCTS